MITFITPSRRPLKPWQPGFRRRAAIRSAALWTAGAILMWLGVVSAMVGHDFYSDAGHSTAGSSSFGVAGFVMIAVGALMWRRA